MLQALWIGRLRFLRSRSGLLVAVTACMVVLALPFLLKVVLPSEGGPFGGVALPAVASSAPGGAPGRSVRAQPNPTEIGDQSDERSFLATVSDPFRAVSFLPPAPAPVAAPQPTSAPKPVVPPFPYHYFGRMIDIEGKPMTYLTRDNLLIPIQVSQTLDAAYRVDAITPTQIVVTYIPMDEKVTITIQSAAD